MKESAPRAGAFRLFRRPLPAHEHTSPLDVDFEPPLPAGEKRRYRMILALILTSVVLAAAAQLTLKYGMNRVGAIRTDDLREPGAVALRVARQPAIWIGFALFAFSSVFWLVVLSRASLSFAYPFAALTYVLILLFDRLILHTPVSGLRYGGVALIITGLVLISRTGHA